MCILDFYCHRCVHLYNLQQRMISNIVCAVNDSLYYQMLCKGLVLSLFKYSQLSHPNITILLDGSNVEPLNDLLLQQSSLNIQKIQPLNIICGSVESRTTFARLEIPYLTATKHFDRVLYLDVDTYCMNNIEELFTIEFDTVAMVVPGKDLHIKKFMKQQFNKNLRPLRYRLESSREDFIVGAIDHKYSNAGVMLIDVEKFREKKVKEHVEVLVKTYPDDMLTSDEMALNLLFRGQITELPQEFNTFSFNCQYINTPRIWHFNIKKPIIHTSLNNFPIWLNLFNNKDTTVLRALSFVFNCFGKNRVLAIKSDAYDLLGETRSENNLKQIVNKLLVDKQ
ncbi:unnamed protein product [Didymodactylos carnosus]|uniref:Uncharacterized protein n=1 Tax=Didymodactylos carnosus TaxID=1234261 RepID=A0A813TGB4_9BILA|nr:unnamed protein product [Didymodactylos carnosus]CAF1125315.1 unnamed protein product [Didymodactylos carnosus]CAF3594213.1 unnamed protein product [Didymodactylos carnosus]CAF3902605.1 unnamed protein product [Didymodactylos carnosus]